MIPFDTSYYAYGYNSFGRLSCYECKFKGENRVGDITIGDFWGAEKYLKHINKKGMSIVSIHTFKGKEYWNNVVLINLRWNCHTIGTIVIRLCV